MKEQKQQEQYAAIEDELRTGDQCPQKQQNTQPIRKVESPNQIRPDPSFWSEIGITYITEQGIERPLDGIDGPDPYKREDKESTQH
jgi:hypothetical protein